MHQKNLPQLILVTGVCIIVFFIVLFLFFRRQPDSVPQIPDIPPMAIPSLSSKQFPPKTNEIIFNDYPPGNIIHVATVITDTDGFVTIYTNDHGIPQQLVGHSGLIPAGTTKNIEIPISISAAIGQSFFAVLRQDNGDGAWTDETNDQIMYHPDGTMIMTGFTIEDPAE